jgi:hypothetical protein
MHPRPVEAEEADEAEDAEQDDADAKQLSPRLEDRCDRLFPLLVLAQHLSYLLVEP